VTGVRTVADGFQELHSWANDPVPRIPFGLPFFDGPAGGGIARSETAMIMAYSSVGKTTIGLNIVRNNPGIPTLVISLEMSWRQVIARIVAMETGLSTQQIELDMKLGKIPPYVQQVIDRYPWLVCDDTPAITLKDAKASMRRATELLHGNQPRLVVWDYLELLGGAGLMNKSEAVDKAAQKLRDWHREFDTSGIVIHQVGKGSDTGGHKPLALDDGRYGGHQPMDYVVGAYAPRLERDLDEQKFRQVQPELYLQLLKNRSGAAVPTGKKYHLDPVSMRIQPWAQPMSYLGGSYQAQMIGGA
jgi:replicative DNA helicase